MSRRIEIELTSQRPDGSWTWRAAGAREPKGEMGGDLIAFDASVGDELTVEAEFHIDGIEIIEAFESKKKRPMPETLEILGSGRDQPLVTTQLVSNRKNRQGTTEGAVRIAAAEAIKRTVIARSLAARTTAPKPSACAPAELTVRR